MQYLDNIQDKGDDPIIGVTIINIHFTYWNTCVSNSSTVRDRHSFLSLQIRVLSSDHAICVTAKHVLY